MKAIRLLSGLLGVAFLILALLSLFAEYTNTDVLTETLVRLIVPTALTTCAVLLLRVATPLKQRWIPLWILGWGLMLAAAAQPLYSTYLFGMADGVFEKVSIILVAAISVPIQLWLGARAIRLARRGSAPKQRVPSADDARSPVLYLRPFAVDATASGVDATTDITSLVFNTRTEEQMIAGAVSDIGPCVAIGRPGERMPQLGFDRRYVSEAEWQETVLALMAKARLVIIMGGSSSNYAWELQQAVALVEPRRLVFLMPAAQDELAGFQRIIELNIRGFDRRIPDDAILGARSFRAILYFEADGTPHYAPATPPSHFRRPLTPDITPALKMALRPVYQQFGLVWHPPPLVVSRMVLEAVTAMSAMFFLKIGLFDRWFP
jgi:hypothetical protein